LNTFTALQVAIVAIELGILASLLLIAITTLVALGTIHALERFVLIAVAIPLVVDVRGWRLVSSLLDRERLITGTKPYESCNGGLATSRRGRECLEQSSSAPGPASAPR
jgi:hypothetical protein